MKYVKCVKCGEKCEKDGVIFSTCDECVISMYDAIIRNQTKKVSVHLYSQSQPITIEEVRNTYQKGDLFCIMQSTGKVIKFPLLHIFRIVEHDDDLF